MEGEEPVLTGMPVMSNTPGDEIARLLCGGASERMPNRWTGGKSLNLPAIERVSLYPLMPEAYFCFPNRSKT